MTPYHWTSRTLAPDSLLLSPKTRNLSDYSQRRSRFFRPAQLLVQEAPCKLQLVLLRSARWDWNCGPSLLWHRWKVDRATLVTSSLRQGNSSGRTRIEPHHGKLQYAPQHTQPQRSISPTATPQLKYKLLPSYRPTHWHIRSRWAVVHSVWHRWAVLLCVNCGKVSKFAARCRRRFSSSRRSSRRSWCWFWRLRCW